MAEDSFDPEIGQEPETAEKGQAEAEENCSRKSSKGPPGSVGGLEADVTVAAETCSRKSSKGSGTVAVPAAAEADFAAENCSRKSSNAPPESDVHNNVPNQVTGDVTPPAMPETETQIRSQAGDVTPPAMPETAQILINNNEAEILSTADTAIAAALEKKNFAMIQASPPVSPNLNRSPFLETEAEENLAELRKQVAHLNLDLQYQSNLAVNTASDKSRCERELLTLQEQIGELREQLDLAHHQLRHHEQESQTAFEAGGVPGSLQSRIAGQLRLERKLRLSVEERNSALSRRVQKLLTILSEHERFAQQYEAKLRAADRALLNKHRQYTQSQARVSDLRKLWRREIGRDAIEVVKANREL